MAIANGLEKKLRYKIQPTWGVPVTGATGGQALRRTSSNIDLSKATFKSNEIRDDKQRADFRHGMRSVGGAIQGELSVGTYADFMASFCRKAFAAGGNTAALTTVTPSVASGITTFTRAAGSFITDGHKVGDVVRWTGWTTTAVAMNSNNFLITALTATAMSGIFLNGTAGVAKASGDSVTCAMAGKKTWIPTSGHTKDMYTVEHWYSDIAQSEVFDSCVVGGMKIGLPPTGMATVEFPLTGRDMTTQQTAYFTSPAAPTTGGALAAVNGALFVNGVKVATLTGLSIDGTLNPTTGECVGSNVTPDVFLGSADVTGQITAYFEDATLRDQFVNETECSVVGAFTTDNTALAGFLAFVLPRIKLGGAGKDDGEKGMVLTAPFTALLNTAGGSGVSSLDTTLSVQDSTK